MKDWVEERFKESERLAINMDWLEIIGEAYYWDNCEDMAVRARKLAMEED